MPSDRGRAARIALAVLIGALGTTLFAAGLWMAFRPHSKPPVQSEIEPAEPSETTTFTPEGSAESSTTSASVQPTATASASDTPTPGARAIVRAPRVAFRLGASVYVANEDGTGARRIAASPDGPYALSPDGSTLALIEGAKIRLIDVASGKDLWTGEGEEGMTPSWSADSSALAYRKHKPGASDSFEIWRISRTGKSAARVGDGEQASYSTAGNVLVVLNGSTSGEQAFVSVSADGASLRPVGVTGGTATAVGSNGDRIFVGLRNGDRGSDIVSLDIQGRHQRSVAGPVPGEMPAVWTRIEASPDGGRLGLQAQGDDGYSRAFIVVSSGGDMIPLSQRRDAALHGWTAKGDRLFLIQGNAFQGEPTSLVTIRRDGTARRDVVTGAE